LLKELIPMAVPGSSEKKKKSRSFPLLVLCFGIGCVVSALLERGGIIGPHNSRGAIVGWQQQLAAGAIAIAISIYALFSRTKK
jgi:hypothetical protein